MIVMTDIQAASIVAKQFEERGYSVTFEPSPADIPIDLGGYRPDIWATKPDENILVEVKRASIKVDTLFFLRIAHKVHAHPGWKFQLVTLPEPDTKAADEAPAQTVEQVQQLLAQVAPLALQPTMAAFAIVPLWSAYAATLRLLAQPQSYKVRPQTDLSLLNQAYTLGILSFQEFEEAKRLREIRNQCVHNLNLNVAFADVITLKAMVEQLLQQLGPHPHT
jgi:hypothetical protein